MTVQYLSLVSNFGDSRYTPFSWTMFKGLSTDTKPSAVTFDGCMFIETDTGKMAHAQGGVWITEADFKSDFAHGAGQKAGFYGKSPIAQQANTAGAVSASGTYGANEQKMLQDCYTLLRNIGLLS